jgi:uncharacterized OsmC-like protein
MSEVSLKWVGEKELEISFDKPDSYKLRVEATPELGGKGQAPDPNRMLAATVGSCLTLSLLLNLQGFKPGPKELSTKVKYTIGTGEQGLPRFKSIDVEIKPVFGGTVKKEFLKRITDNFQKFCTVTESVRKGIPVNVTIKE